MTKLVEARSEGAADWCGAVDTPALRLIRQILTQQPVAQVIIKWAHGASVAYRLKFELSSPWRPMNELPDDHLYSVHVAYVDGSVEVRQGTERQYDETQGRIGWAPIEVPPHPREMQS